MKLAKKHLSQKQVALLAEVTTTATDQTVGEEFAEFRRQKKAAKSGKVLEMEIVEVSPDLAASWLKRNHPRNRDISQRQILLYAEDMDAGLWKLTHQGIAFDTDGFVIDGQHRLSAVVLAGKTVPFTVFHYGNLDAMSVLDCGTKRTAGHSLEIGGLTRKGEGKRFAATAVALHIGLRGTDTTSRGVIEKIYGAHKSGMDWAISSFGGKAHISAFLAAFAYAYPVNPAKVTEMGRRIMTKVGLVEGSPELAVVRWLDGTTRSSKGTAERKSGFLKVLRAIEMFLTDRALTKLQEPRNSGNFTTEETHDLPQCISFFMNERKKLNLPVDVY